MSKFSTYLKHKLEQNNLSQNKFAKMIGVSPTYVGDMINGRKGPPDKDLQIKIANSLNIFGSDRYEFFNRIAKEKNEIPSDIYVKVLSNQDKWNQIRKFLEEKWTISEIIQKKWYNAFDKLYC